MNLTFPQNRNDYLHYRTRVSRWYWIWNALAAAVVGVFWPTALLYYSLGVVLGYFYLLSLFWAAEVPPQKGFAIAFMFLRIICVSFLIVWLGQFKLLETCVVFLGFLSYKIVLILEFVRFSVGIRQNSGK